MNLALPREVTAAQELSAKDTKPHLILEVEQETTMDAHPDLYSKGHTDDMTMHRKDALWQHPAVAPNPLPKSQVEHVHE